MAIKTSSSNSIQKAFEVILSKRSSQYIQAYGKALENKLQEDATEWQTKVRELLSEPVIGTFGKADYVPNKTLYPKKKQGRLVDAILIPRISRRYSTSSSKLRRNQIAYQLTDFFGPRIDGTGVDSNGMRLGIGKELDKMVQSNPHAPGYGRKKTFNGWIKRVEMEWWFIMMKRKSEKLYIGKYL